MSLLDQTTLDHVDKLYMDTGTKETEDAQENDRYCKRNEMLYLSLQQKISQDRLTYSVIPDAIHHESAWQDRFADIIRYLYSD